MMMIFPAQAESREITDEIDSFENESYSSGRLFSHKEMSLKTLIKSNREDS